ncbi:MAG: phage holin family protein [Oscillospiraceae bacterium]
MNKDILKSISTIVLTIIGYLFGEIDGLMYALLTVIIIDYITGTICAIVNKKLCSKIGFRGILKKISILIIVSVSQIIDVSILSDSGILRSSVIAFYIINESISILENSSNIGIPLPKKLKSVLSQLKDDTDKN